MNHLKVVSSRSVFWWFYADVSLAQANYISKKIERFFDLFVVAIHIKRIRSNRTCQQTYELAFAIFNSKFNTRYFGTFTVMCLNFFYLDYFFVNYRQSTERNLFCKIELSLRREKITVVKRNTRFDTLSISNVMLCLLYFLY